MAELLQEYSTRVRGEDGTLYVVLARGEERADGTWKGWLEFHATHGIGPVLRTGQETSQPNRTCIRYWASGVEPIYLDGALERARRRAP